MLTDEYRYRILKLLQADPHASQRRIAEELGISLGRVNYCLKALVSKGLIKANNFRNNRNKRTYLYLLTPKGIEEKSRVALRFLKVKLNEYENLKRELEELQREAASPEKNAPIGGQKKSAMLVRVFVQARMSSKRFPGKVLSPLAGRPMISHVLERCGQAFGDDKVVLATSADPSDDMLAAYAESIGHTVFRGELDNVVGRFQRCLAAYPCEWFVRISGDSPLIDPELIARITERRDPQYDLVTNVQIRSFPPGQSVEVIRAECFAKIDSGSLSAPEREHVTLLFYQNPAKYRIYNVLSRDPLLARHSLAVDTAEDLRTVEALIASQSVPAFAHSIGSG